jgi:hypothetical protein
MNPENNSAGGAIYFLPWDPHTWNPVVLMQMAVKEAMEVTVEVVVMVDVPKAK